MKRLKIELWALGVATAVTALFSQSIVDHEPKDPEYLSASEIHAEAAAYLEAEPRSARFDRHSQQWTVTDGQSTAWLDARSGQLLEVRFDAP